ncbi:MULTISPECIES: type II secretion system minor pseudopilin GspH [unclassified Raoultella]|uniref:type II secretion system minor pseudopilin GspH n=1 Tax=unclassified Raoultella TaxID=2627600 RepID=UPI00135B333F|nr:MULTISPECIES: type II secretion system minor pseudopilin GspH [unclassified Raoultella]
MQQRGFTLLEMMLILLLMGVSAGMVMLAFPPSRENDPAKTLERFEAQLSFVRDRGLQTGQFYGISIHPDRWQFMRLLTPDESGNAGEADDGEEGSRWQPLQIARVATSGSAAPEPLALSFPDGAAWTPGELPDVLLFPGGEVTPFQLHIGRDLALEVDARGGVQPTQREESP